MKSTLFFIFALLLPLCTVAQSRTPELEVPKYRMVKAEKDSTGFEERPYFILIEQSEKALEENRYDDAALRLVEAMGVEPENPLNVALLSNLGMIYYYSDKDSLAMQCLDKVVSRSPRLIAGHENRARVLAGLGRDKEAIIEYGKVIELDSLNTDARFYHGIMSLYAGDIPTAESDFKVLETMIPLSRTTHLAMGTLYAMTGREQQAASYLRKLVDVEPAAEYYAMLAECYLVTGNLADAADVLGKAFEKYPNDGELYYCRAWLNRDRYESKAALQDADMAIKHGANPKKVRALFK